MMNTITLVCCWRVLCYGCEASEALKPFKKMNIDRKIFHDVHNQVHCSVTITDVVEGVAWAAKLGLFRFDIAPTYKDTRYKLALPPYPALRPLPSALSPSCLADAGFMQHFFDPAFFNFYDRTKNGNISWIVPGKLVAFQSPADYENPDEPISDYRLPTGLLFLFSQSNCSCSFVILTRDCFIIPSHPFSPLAIIIPVSLLNKTE